MQSQQKEKRGTKMYTKELLMDLVIKNYGFEDPFTIEFCRECEKEDSNIIELYLLIIAYATVEKEID